MTTPHAPAGDRVAGYRHGRVPRAVRERQMLDLAEGLFVEHGYAGFSIEDLCRAAGVSRPVVYDHFGSRDGIYLACLRRIRDGFDETLLASAAGSDLPGALRGGAEAFFGIIESRPRIWSLVYGSPGRLTGELADELFALRSRTTDRIAALVTRFLPDADPEAVTATAHALSGAGEQLGRWWLRNPTVDRDRIVEYFLITAGGSLTRLAQSSPDGPPAGTTPVQETA